MSTPYNRPTYFVWSQGGRNYHGYDLVNAQWVDAPLVFPVTAPGGQFEFENIYLRSSASKETTYEILVNVNVYLDAPDTASLALVNGMVEISFDHGKSYQMLTPTPIVLPAVSIGSQAADGTLGPEDTACIFLRVTVPVGFINYQKIMFSVDVDGDVL